MSDGDISINLRLEDKDFSVTVRNAGRLLSELRQNLNATASGANAAKQHFSSFTTQLRHTVMTLASIRFALMDIHDVFLQFPKAILKSTGEVERMTKLMEGLSKETDELRRKQEAAANTKFVFNLAQNAPFEVKALSDAFIKLKIAGLDPTNGSLQTLVDSIARFGGTSEHMHRASVAIQQMVGKGVISMEELRQQLGEAMPTAMQAMAKGTGLSMSDLVNKISKGTVEAKSALERMFAVLKTENDGAALKMMDSYVGQIEKLKTSWTIFANEVGQSGGFAKEVTEQLKNLNKLFAAPESKKFAHELSSGLAAAVRGIADMIGFVREYSDEIGALGRVMLAVWGGSKVLGAINMLKGVWKSFVDHSVGALHTLSVAEKDRVMIANANAQAELAMKRQMITAEAIANAQKINQNAAAAAAELAQNRAKHAALLAEHNSYYARYQAADRIATTKRSASGKFVSASEVANQRALATAYFERAMAAERMAVQIKASEASLLATSTGTMAALRANTAAATAQMTALGNATTITTSKANILRGALGLLGGPIGIITTLLTAGVFAWFEWGRSAEEAANRVADAMKRAKDGYASLEDAAEISKRIDNINKEIAQKEVMIDAHSGSDMTGFNARKTKELNSDIQALIKERDEKKRALQEATKQGNKSEVENFVRLADEALAEKINTIKKSNREEIAETHKALQTKLEENKISQDEYLKEQGKLDRQVGIRDAQGEVAAIKERQAYIDDQIRKAAEGTNGYSALIEQKKALAVALRSAETGLVSALKVGTESGYVKKGGAGNDKKGHGTPISSLIERAEGDLAAASIKLDDLADGVISFRRIRDAMLAEIEGDIKAGTITGANEASKGKLADARARLNQRKAEIAAEAKISDLGRGVEADLNRSISRLSNGDNYEAETTGLKRLQNSIADILSTLDPTSAAAKKFSEATKELVSKQALADINNFAADLAKSNAEIEASLEPTERGRQQKRHEAEIRDLKNAFEKRREAILADVKLTEKEKSDAMEAAAARLDESLRLRNERNMRAMRTPMEQLAEEWKNVAGQMEQASVRWADQTIDLLMELTTTGKANFKDFAVSILKDIARIQMKESLSGAIAGALGGATKLLTSVYQKGAIGPTQGGGNLDSGSQVAGIFGIIADAGRKLWDSLTVASGAADQQAASTGNLLTSLAAQVFQTGAKTTADQAATYSMASLTAAANTAAQAMLNVTTASLGGGGSSGGFLGSIVSTALGSLGAGPSVPAGYSMGDLGSGIRLTASANGNIMTSMGPLALRKYASGGIARTPQLSLFGEGSMPEAYVPLPDGRTIPVTIRGAAGASSAPVVTISITVNEAQGTETTAGGDDGQWSKLAGRLKTVVREELAQQKRPGGMLY